MSMPSIDGLSLHFRVGCLVSYSLFIRVEKDLCRCTRPYCIMCVVFAATIREVENSKQLVMKTLFNNISFPQN